MNSICSDSIIRSILANSFLPQINHNSEAFFTAEDMIKIEVLLTQDLQQWTFIFLFFTKKSLIFLNRFFFPDGTMY